VAERSRKSGKSANSAWPGTRSGGPAITPAKTGRGGAVASATGIDAFARAAGTSADDVLAVTAFLLAGLAGSEAWLGKLEYGTPLAKLDLLVRRRDEEMRRMAGQLVARLRGLNRALVEGLQDFSPGVVDLLRRGAYAGGREAKYADPEDTDKARQRLTGQLEDKGAASSALTEDLSQAGGASRVEALLHPQFLLEAVRCRELEGALDQCHQRTALVVGLKTDPTRTGSEPARDLRGLLDLMEGLATPRWEPATGRSRVIPLRAHVLLEAGGDNLALMARLLPDMPGCFLWLSSPAGNGRAARPDEESLAAGARLIGSFSSAAMEILSFRRAGQVVAMGDDDAFPAKWHRAMERYRCWVAHLAARHQVDAGPALRDLPGALCFGLAFLCRHRAEDQGMAPAMVAVLAAAFRSARRLARRHCCELSLFLNAERVEQGLELARQIVDKLEEKGPLSRRGLVRCFGNQRMERFEPVIGALTQVGVLERGEDGILAVGDAELAEVEEHLREALLAPVAADVRKANPPQAAAKSRAPAAPKARAGKGKKPAGKAPGKTPGKAQ
jgi:hypothetical protein